MNTVMELLDKQVFSVSPPCAAMLALSCSLLFSLSSPLSALEATLEEGMDSNPFKLSDPTDLSRYTRLAIEHKGKHDLANKRSLRYSAAWRSKWYEADASDADKHQLDGRLRWINRFKIGGRSANLLITGDVRMDRRTYYSQIQRGVASTSGGDSLAERFDYNSARVAAEFIYRFEGGRSLAVYAYSSQRDYVEDYDGLGLESLDYTENGVQPTFRYKSGGLYLRAFVYSRERCYDELLNDDLLGVNIEQSPVSYHFNGYGVLLKKSLSEKMSFKAYLSGYHARDDAEGYRDLNYQKLDLLMTYTLSGQRMLEVGGHCSSRDYLIDSARPPESETGNAGRLRETCGIRVSYEGPLTQVEGRPLNWRLRMSHEFEDNSDNYLSYTRSMVSLGLNYSFD